MKPVQKPKYVFIGNWSYLMPDTKPNSDGRIVLIQKLSFGPCEVYEWGIDINSVPYEEYKWCENEYFKDESYFKHITEKELTEQIEKLIRAFTENGFSEWASHYQKILNSLKS